jgi:hypothetical protein
VGLLPEVEVRRQRMLRQVHNEVPDENGDESVRGLRGVRQHPEHDDGEHEPGAEAGEGGERAPIAAGSPDDEEPAGDIAQGRQRGPALPSRAGPAAHRSSVMVRASSMQRVPLVEVRLLDHAVEQRAQHSPSAVPAAAPAP